MQDLPHISVIGAGVSGLSVGILLLRKGYAVTIHAKEFSPNTTSDVAAAIWVPFHCGPADKVPGWAADTFAYFKREIVPDPESGCFPEKLVSYFKEPESDPDWASLVNLKRISNNNLPAGFVDGYEFDSLMMDSRLYMPYLTKLFTDLGGILIQETVLDISQFLKNHPITVNCSGLGSRVLFNDTKVYPSRGQVMRIQKTSLLEAVCYNKTSEDLVFVMPRTEDMILGGTAQDNDWRTDMDPADNERMLVASHEIGVPVDPASVIETKIGFRPARDEIRLEVEKLGNSYVIHNYGHGGGGYTLSWGCAMEVVKLIQDISIN